MRIAVAILSLAAAPGSAHAKSLSLEDLNGTWRLSAVSTAKYGCDNPGAMTVNFKSDGQSGLIGDYASPGISGTHRQRFNEYASMTSMIVETAAGGRAITLDAPAVLRRVLAVETELGQDGKPTKLEWRSTFGGFGEDHAVFTDFAATGWLTRCPG